MEFHVRLQELRKKKGLTQEELAGALYVSRTAVSKWESGRGYPHIDSLRAIAKFFDITVDDLLSGDELLTIAEEDGKRKESRLRDLVFGLLDVSAVLLLFLPFFGQKVDGAAQGSSLLLFGGAPYLKAAYYAVVLGLAVLGIAALALQNCDKRVWVRSKSKLSVGVNVLGALLFVISLQPYAATFLLTILAIKVLMLIKRP